MAWQLKRQVGKYPCGHKVEVGGSLYQPLEIPKSVVSVGLEVLRAVADQGGGVFDGGSGDGDDGDDEDCKETAGAGELDSPLLWLEMTKYSLMWQQQMYFDAF